MRMLSFCRVKLLPFTIVALSLFFHESELLGEEKAKREKELVRIALDIKKAIVGRDVETLLKYVDSQGVMCVDEQVPFERIKRDIQDTSSYLYMYLFDSVRYREKYGKKDTARPVAWIEYFQKATDLKVRIGFKQGFEPNWADVEYFSKAAPTGVLGPKVMAFKYSNNRWTIDTGLYGCGGY